MVLILIKLNAVNNLLLYNLYENYINYYFLFQYILLYNNINDKKMTSTTIAEVIFLYYLSISPLHGWLILLQVRTTLHKPTNTFTMRFGSKVILIRRSNGDSPPKPLFEIRGYSHREI